MKIITSLIILSLSFLISNQTEAQCLNFDSILITPSPCYSSQEGDIWFYYQNGNSPFTYTWTGDSTGSTIDSSGSFYFRFPLQTGCYSITVEDALGCSSVIDTCIPPPPDRTQGYYTIIYGSQNAIRIDSIIGTGYQLTVAFYMFDSASSSRIHISSHWPSATPILLDSLSYGEYYLHYFDANGCYVEDTILLAPLLAQNTLTKKSDSKISIFPLPVTQKINILIKTEKPSEYYDLEIVTIAGSVALKKKLSDSTINFNIEDLPNGLYILRIGLENEILNKKFIVQRE